MRAKLDENAGRKRKRQDSSSSSGGQQTESSSDSDNSSSSSGGDKGDDSRKKKGKKSKKKKRKTKTLKYDDKYNYESPFPKKEVRDVKYSKSLKLPSAQIPHIAKWRPIYTVRGGGKETVKISPHWKLRSYRESMTNWSAIKHGMEKLQNKKRSLAEEEILKEMKLHRELSLIHI